MNLEHRNNSVIFALETSCDETAAAVVRIAKGKPKILANIISSQIKIHQKYGGVVPEVAARHHLKNIIPVINESLALAKIKPAQIDLLAVTAGPGLITSLLVGVETAKALSFAWQKPLLPVNHLYGHMAANFLTPIKFPAMALIVSGGHTELIFLKNYQHYKKIGQTLDDAAGEAFDKVAKLLNLGYPGGPIISAEAGKFADSKSPVNLKLPRPMIKSNDYNFSFSGLKTAVLYAAQKMKKNEVKKRTPEICYEFQEAAVEVLTKKTIKAARSFGAKTIILAGGVAANKRLRENLKSAAIKAGLEFLMPEFSLCTDNAAMIALAANFLSRKNIGWQKVVVDQNWEL